MLRPIVMFFAGSGGLAVLASTVSVFIFDQYMPSYGQVMTWQISVFSSLLLAGIYTIGSGVAMRLIPMVIPPHLSRLGWLAFGVGVLAIALPAWLIGPLTLIVGPLLAGVLTWAIMRRALTKGYLIAVDAVGRCSYCGYNLAPSGASRCPECGGEEKNVQDRPT